MLTMDLSNKLQIYTLQHWFISDCFHSENKHFDLMLWYFQGFQTGVTDPYPSAAFQMIPFFMKNSFVRATRAYCRPGWYRTGTGRWPYSEEDRIGTARVFSWGRGGQQGREVQDKYQKWLKEVRSFFHRICFDMQGKSTGVTNSFNDGCRTVRCVSCGVVCFLSSAVKKTSLIFMTNAVDHFNSTQHETFN